MKIKHSELIEIEIKVPNEQVLAFILSKSFYRFKKLINNEIRIAKQSIKDNRMNSKEIQIFNQSLTNEIEKELQKLYLIKQLINII